MTAVGTPPSLFDPAPQTMRAPIGEPRPRARATDPRTAHLAAVAVKPGTVDLVTAISNIVGGRGPISAFDIARWVEGAFPGRFDEGSVRTRVSAMEKSGQLRCVDSDGSHKGRSVRRYAL